MNKTIPLMFMSLLLIAGCSDERDFGNADMSDAAVKARIVPVGQLSIEGQTQAEAPMGKATPVEEKAPAAAPMVKAARSAKTIYQNSCFACHGTGAAGAPKLGDAGAWAPRAALGIDALLASAKTGKGAMPPKGMCMDCADDELKATIEYMLNNSK
jgi:cytochrome c5